MTCRRNAALCVALHSKNETNIKDHPNDETFISFIIYDTTFTLKYISNIVN